MKCLLNNRISTYSTTSTMESDFPLANIVGSAPQEVAKASGNVLLMDLVTTTNDSTIMTGCNTNADTVKITVTSVADAVTNGDFSLTTGWTLGTGWSIASGVCSCDGTQTADSAISQSVTTVNGETSRVELTISAYTAGAITEISLGGVSQTVSLTAVGTYTYDFLVTDNTYGLSITGDSTFVGSLDDISCKHLGHEETRTITTWANWADYFDDYDQDNQRRDFYIEFDEAMTEAADISLTFTSATGTLCYCGPIRVDRAITINNPHYGFTREQKRNDVEIKKLDASVYRRHRTAQVQYSGTFTADRDGDVVTIMQAIQYQLGSAPIPWIILDGDQDTVVFGGLTSGQQSYDLPGHDNYTFTITGEV